MGKQRTGRLHREIRRAFIASRGKPVTTRELLRRCWPTARRFEPNNQCRALGRAAARYAVVVARSPRGHRAPTLYAPRPELLALIRGDDEET